MTTIFAFFLLSTIISIVATPYMGKLGRWIGALDYPDNKRKIHDGIIPRSGGLAIYLGFFTPFVSLFCYQTGLTRLIEWNSITFGFLACSSLILLVGLWDDIRRLRAWIKLVLQIMVASLAWWSGFKIEVMFIPYLGNVEFSLFSLPVTVFWFLMVINAINLVDGLDGLAAGIALFASMILALISLTRNNLLAALMFASFSGSLLGFLRYNFNPASVFLGDSGSYFIGFVLAALGLGTTQKSSVTVAILIPVVALGLPLMDMVLAATRRFIFGIKIFSADKEHIHHRLLQLGCTPRRAALLFYGITIILGLIALFMENLRDDKVGLILGALAVMSIVGIRKLGYLEYFTADKVLGWFADITDEAGMTRGRRTFLNQQVAISTSENIFQFWCRTIYAAEKIKLSSVSLELHPQAFNGCILPSFTWRDGSSGETRESEKDRCVLVELRLASNGKCYGILRLEKCLNQGNYDAHTLRRIEHLRRTLTRTLERFAEKSLTCSEVLQDRRSVCHLPDSEPANPTDAPKWNGPEQRKFWDQEVEKNKAGRRQPAVGSPSTSSGQVSS